MKQLSFEELEELVIQWAGEKGILEHATPITQVSKTIEEVAELVQAIGIENRFEQNDAIGDIVVTLIIVNHLLNLNGVAYSLQSAYNVISKRTGVIREGKFVKD